MVFILEIIYLSIINLDEYSNIGTHWVALWLNNNNVLEWNIFQKKYKKLSIILRPLLRKIKILKQIFSEYKYMIR